MSNKQSHIPSLLGLACAALLAIRLASAAPAFAEEVRGVIPRGVGLANGMSSSEILERWGPPRERIERESKRQEVWVYAGQNLVIENGRLVSWDGAAPDQVFAAPAAESVSPRKPSRKSRKVSEQTVDEILTELKGYGSDSPGLGDGPPSMGFIPTPFPGMAMPPQLPPDGQMTHVP